MKQVKAETLNKDTGPVFGKMKMVTLVVKFLTVDRPSSVLF